METSALLLIDGLFLSVVHFWEMWKTVYHFSD